MIPETYVQVIREWKTSGGPDIFSPIDLVKGTIYLGLTVIGAVPKNAEVVGDFDEKTGKLTLREKEIKKETP
jgi:hypothetical protein